MRFRLPWTKPDPIPKAPTKFTDRKLRHLIRSGVAARVLVEVQQSHFQASGHIADLEERRSHADLAAGKTVTDPISGPILNKKIDDETDQCMAWIRSARCHRESFARAVGTHVGATLVLTIGGFLILLCAGVFMRTHPASKVAETAGSAATSIVNTIAPETEREKKESGKDNAVESEAPAHAGSAGHTP